MKTIPLTRGLFALVDDEDFEYLYRFKWFVKECKHVHGPSTFYAARTSSRASGHKMIMMHRVILGLTPGDKLDVDHINHNGLDNRRENLRVATNAQNQANYKSNHGSSQFKGVSWHEGTSKWQAGIQKDRKSTPLGCYPTEEMAARAYDEAALAQWGEYALPNFGPDNPESAEEARRRHDLRRNPRGGSSRYRGVSWKKAIEKWRAYINKDGRRLHLGYFSSEEDAAYAYDAAAVQIFGDFARLNFEI